MQVLFQTSLGLTVKQETWISVSAIESLISGLSVLSGLRVLVVVLLQSQNSLLAGYVTYCIIQGFVHLCHVVALLKLV